MGLFLLILASIPLLRFTPLFRSLCSLHAGFCMLLNGLLKSRRYLILFFTSISHNHLICKFIFSCFVTFRWYARRTYWMTTTRSFTFTTTMWVIYWIHRDTTNGWTNTAPSYCASFTK